MDSGDSQPSLPPTPEAAYSDYVEQAPPPHAPPGPWTFWNLALFLAFSVVAFLFSFFGVVAGYTVLKPFMGWRLSERALGENTFFLLLVQAVSYLFILLFLYLLIVVNHGLPFWRALAWRQPTVKQTLTCLAAGIVLALAAVLAPPLLPETQKFPLERLFSSPSAGYAVGGFAIFVAPLLEELVFRGFLFRIFEHRVGLRFAVAVTAILFAGLHVQEYWGAWNHVLLILVVGLVFSVARGLTGSLAPSIILHAAYNTCMMAGLYFSTQHFRNLPSLLC